MLFDKQAEQKIDKLFSGIYEIRDRNFANGRTVRNIFEKSLQNQSVRIEPLITAGSAAPEILNTITAEDIPDGG